MGRDGVRRDVEKGSVSGWLQKLSKYDQLLNFPTIFESNPGA